MRGCLLPRLAIILVALAAAAGPVPGAPAEAPPVTGPWQSETFSTLASGQLSRLGESLRAGIPVPAGVVASGASCRVEPKRFAPVVDGRGLGVRTAAGGGTWPVEPRERLVAALTSPFASLDGGRVKFKLFAIGFEKPRQPVTRQYVTLAGPCAEGYRERNAVWRITWSWDPEAQAPPVITAIDGEQLEEVTWSLGEGRRLFREATGEVVGASDAWRDQLRHGNTHWRQRIEIYNRFFKFGHHGLAIGDVNGDGREDVYVCQNGGLPNRLLVQQPDGTVRDTAAEAGVDLLDLTRAALLVDLDNDGDEDLVLAADTGLLAYENDGLGRFAGRLRVPSVANAFSLSAADYDNDGDLDLYVCRYFARREEGAQLAVPVPYFAAENGGGNYLIRNEGPARRAGNWLDMTDATRESGLDAAHNRRFSFASVWDDIDADGDQDLFVANDFGLKNLYLNEGGRFRDTAVEAGVDDGGFGMSACSGDFDRDGIVDLYAGNMFSAAGNRVTFQPQFRPGLDPGLLRRFQRMARGNSLFRGLGADGEGDPRFADVSVDAGVTVGRWSWGALFADLNNDGWDDLVVANGFVTGQVPDDL